MQEKSVKKNALNEFFLNGTDSVERFYPFTPSVTVMTAYFDKNKLVFCDFSLKEPFSVN